MKRYELQKLENIVTDIYPGCTVETENEAILYVECNTIAVFDSEEATH